MIKIKYILLGFVSVFILGIITLLTYGIASGQITGDNLIYMVTLAFVPIVIKLASMDRKPKQSEPAAEFMNLALIPETEMEPAADPDTIEKKRQARNDIETYSLMIEQYAELSGMIETELEYTLKETNRRKLKEKQINLENKIHALEVKRNKAYYILHN